MVRATVWTVGLFGAGAAICRMFPAGWVEPLVLVALGLALLFVSRSGAPRRDATAAPVAAATPVTPPTARAKPVAVPAPVAAPPWSARAASRTPAPITAVTAAERTV